MHATGGKVSDKQITYENGTVQNEVVSTGSERLYRIPNGRYHIVNMPQSLDLRCSHLISISHYSEPWFAACIQTCANIPKRSKILDPQDPGSCGILDSIFSFCHGILKILAILLWDHRDLGSWTENICLDPGNPGSSLSKLS